MKPTKLEQFLRSHRIRPSDLAREAGYSRQHPRRIRMGETIPTDRCIDAVTAACGRLAVVDLNASDLFDNVRQRDRSRRANADREIRAFLGVLSALGSPVALLCGSLRPAADRRSVDRLLLQLSPRAIRRALAAGAPLEPGVAIAVVGMLKRLRRRIAEVNLVHIRLLETRKATKHVGAG